jgi:hypothetical protein
MDSTETLKPISGGLGESRVQSDLQTVTADLAGQRSSRRFQSFCLPAQARSQYFEWKTARLISGQNSFKMLRTPSSATCVTHFCPVLVQVRSLPG